jgi:aryl-alcohol dehydrogenase-like predicted oxidoreductase
MTVESTELAPGYRIPRLIRGGWQLAGGHGAVDRQRAVADMATFVAAGIDVFDCADIYTGVEELIGAFRATPQGRALRVHTKFVPDLDDLAHVDAAYVRRVIERSLQRLNAERLDLVQFHWWDYAVPGLVDTALQLVALQREGLIAHVGGTNFDTPHAAAGLCATSGMQLLCYGTLAGGFFGERWLGAAEPTVESLANRSLVKYKLVIDDFGGWAAFQSLLAVLARIGAKHGVGIAAVATRWVLDQPQVAAAIVGARYAEHLPAMLPVFSFVLDDDDHAQIDALLAECPGPQGDTYTLERDRSGRHGRIMRYNLNKT